MSVTYPPIPNQLCTTLCSSRCMLPTPLFPISFALPFAHLGACCPLPYSQPALHNRQLANPAHMHTLVQLEHHMPNAAHHDCTLVKGLQLRQEHALSGRFIAVLLAGRQGKEDMPAVFALFIQHDACMLKGCRVLCCCGQATCILCTCTICTLVVHCMPSSERVSRVLLSICN